MFPQGARLKAGRQFTQVLRKGKKLTTPSFRLRWLNNFKDEQHFAVVVSRKFSNKAVKRNKIKRQIRAILKENLANIAKIDLVIYLNPSAPKKFQDLKNELVEALGKIK